MPLHTALLSVVLFHTLHTITVVRGGDGGACAADFENGQEGFVLDTDTSVGRGAALIASAQVTTAADCVAVCCELAQCNVVLIQERDAGNTTCSLFNCLYKQAFACRFVRKTGFSSFVLKSVFQQHLAAPEAKGDTAGPVAVAGRNAVVMPGQEVTLWGVESRAPAGATVTDYKWSLLKGDSSVVSEAKADQLLVSNLSPGTYVFQLQVTDSNGQSDTASVNILVLDQEESDMYCLALPEVGLCRALFQRWHYNAAAGRCQEFVYGGCKGNRNNFLSDKECTKACATVKASCTEPPKTGPCHSNRSAWYYNPLQKGCNPFNYSGCHGNGNNFELKEICEQTCKGVTMEAVFAPGRFDELEESESGSIAIAVVLAVSILALLAVLAFFFLKGQRKRVHQPVATTPPPLGEGGHRDTVVYRSTTKP
ncbi:hypothetical protein NHX12_026070, partial [Muraenolepis orangiensis]